MRPCWPALWLESCLTKSAADDPQGRRRPLHFGRNDPLGEEYRHAPRSRARDVYRREREAAHYGGGASALAGQIVLVMGVSSGHRARGGPACSRRGGPPFRGGCGCSAEISAGWTRNLL